MYDALREANELREQLASDKRRVAFLFGAGTSQAIGIPGSEALTRKVPEHLESVQKNHYERLLKEAGTSATVEHVLDTVRLCREFIGESSDREAAGLKGASAIALDRAICRAIFELVSCDPPTGLAPHVTFAGWARSIRRASPIEIFTTNYDVLIERGLEAGDTPHYDGFVGSVNPAFSVVTVEADPSRTYEAVYPPRSWVRVWKLHGSIGWRASVDGTTGSIKITRSHIRAPSPAEDLLIFPSRQKYSDSRKLPFVAYHDRLRRLLSTGETLLIVAGYSFGDEHINEILFEALRNNSRLAAVALMFEPLSSAGLARLVAAAEGLRNLSVYGPDQACIAGGRGGWTAPAKKPPPPLTQWPFWDESAGRFTLGDFGEFTNFLKVFFSVRDVSPSVAASGTTAPVP